MTNEQMKQFFGEFVDQLTNQNQIAAVHREIVDVENLITTSINKLSNEFNNSLHSIQETLSSDVVEIKAQLAILKREIEIIKSTPSSNKHSEIDLIIEKKISTFENSFSLLTEKVAQSFHNQKSAVEERIGSIELRATAGETEVSSVRQEQKRITSLLHQFASTISQTNHTSLTPVQTIDRFDIPKQAVTSPTPTLLQEQTKVPEQRESQPSFQNTPEPLIAETKVAIAPIIPETPRSMNKSVEFEINLNEIEFLNSDSNRNGDVIIDSFGQHIYKPL